MTTSATARPSLSPALIHTAGVAIDRGEVTINGVRLHYLTCGQGEPLLMLRGLDHVGALYADLRATGHTTENLRVGPARMGLSDTLRFTGTTAQDALNDWRDGALGFMDALEIAQADLLGHSLKSGRWRFRCPGTRCSSLPSWRSGETKEPCGRRRQMRGRIV
jgi:hypothetical protein